MGLETRSLSLIERNTGSPLKLHGERRKTLSDCRDVEDKEPWVKIVLLRQ